MFISFLHREHLPHHQNDFTEVSWRLKSLIRLLNSAWPTLCERNPLVPNLGGFQWHRVGNAELHQGPITGKASLYNDVTMCSVMRDLTEAEWSIYASAKLCQWRIGACSAPSHYLNQCWNIVDWTLRNKLSEIWRRNYVFLMTWLQRHFFGFVWTL